MPTTARMLQARLRLDLRVLLGLSGVTPGDRDKLAFHRVSCTAPVGQNRSRQVRLVGAFRRHVRYVRFDAPDCTGTRSPGGRTVHRADYRPSRSDPRLPLEFDPRDLRDARTLYQCPHLPQGAPTSPALANLCAYRADCRLAGLAESAGALYTRYADDLAFSGGEDFEQRVERFSTHAAAILHEEGFVVHHRKTRIMRQGVRQHLAGLVANQSVNVIRADFDLLKAVLTNCVRLGPDSQNRSRHPDFRSHLEGRIGFVEMINPAKAQRLRGIFHRIPWQ